jgi:hypothetical protein
MAKKSLQIDTKGVSISCKSKNRPHIDKKKKDKGTNSDLQNII